MVTHGPRSTPSEYPRHAARGFREASGNIETLAEHDDRRNNLRSQDERADARDALEVSVSKERYTKGVKAGTFELSERAAIRQAHAQVRREILSHLPGLGPADERAIFKWRRLRMSGEASPAGEEGSMTAAEKDRIKSLFDRYEKNMWPLIRRAFGSGQSWYETPDVGAFSVAA